MHDESNQRRESGESFIHRHKVICAPASFKETLTATQVAQAMAAGVGQVVPPVECDVCPIGDGGEGTLEALVSAMDGSFREATVTGPLGEPVGARWGVADAGKLGIVELAQASGLSLVPREKRNPMNTTTFGTGQLIQAAIDAGCERIIVCIGGSATIDGGAGMAQALGVRFYDSSDNLITQPMTGELLWNTSRVERDAQRLPRIVVACDVTNPLTGPSGAAAVYGPQKGATPEQIRELEVSLSNLAARCGVDSSVPGCGAAGGAGYGLFAMCGAKLQRGIELVLDAVQFAERCHGASLILTGEGRLDAQSLAGKACLGVARATGVHSIPTFAIVGSTGLGADKCVGESRWGLLSGFVSLADRYGTTRAMREPAELIAEIAEQVVREQL